MPPSNNRNSANYDEDTGRFEFGPDLKANIKEKLSDLPEEAHDRLLDLVRLQPTSNSKLKNQWDMASGSEVHQYLESELNPYYYRNDDSYICVTEEAKGFVRENSGLNQYVTEDSDNSEDVSENIRNRDLLMDLVSVAQSIGHLPDEEEIEAHSNYSADRFREEFGSLFEACQEAGIVPDSVTKDDYTAATEAKKEQEEAEAEEEESDPKPSGPSEAELIEELQWVDEEVEGIPYPADMNESGAFTAHDYQEAFGSWDDALDVAGIDKEEQLLEDMQVVAEEVGEDMTAPEMNEYGRYSSTMAARYFGSWTEAKERFQEWRSEQEEEEDDSAEEFDNMVNDRLDDILG
jgi:hypothetical protein